MDICIYTTNDTLRKKRGLNQEEFHCYEYYWRLRRKPKQLISGAKIYFATNKMIRGYFIIDHIEELDQDCYEITFRKETWKSVKNKPTKQFQGFKYMNGIKEI